MYRALSLLVVAMGLGLCLASQASAQAPPQAYAVRQYYGGWQQGDGFKYRAYYYKPTPTYVGYKHHYVIWSPQKPNHYYFYNHYTKKFWGRCPTETYGKPQYSLLEEKYRQSDLSQIPENAFPTPGGLPPIPESTDGLKLDLPPDDLNLGVGLRLGG